MSNRISWFNRVMTAVTFAEANESETALEILQAGAGKNPGKKHVTASGHSVLGADFNQLKANS